MGRIDALQILLQDRFHGRVWQDQFAQVTHVGRTPVGVALITVAVTQQEALEPQPAAAQVIDRIGAGAAQIPDGFVGRFGHVDARQFAGAQQAGEAAGVALVGFEGGTGLSGMREGRRPGKAP